MVQQIQSVCVECQGQGERINAKDRCKVCLGKKVLSYLKNIYIFKLLTNGFVVQVVRERKVLEVHVDKGMVDGQKITFNGEGDQEPGLQAGDIIIVLDEKEHLVFK